MKQTDQRLMISVGKTGRTIFTKAGILVLKITGLNGVVTSMTITFWDIVKRNRDGIIFESRLPRLKELEP